MTSAEILKEIIKNPKYFNIDQEQLENLTEITAWAINTINVLVIMGHHNNDLAMYLLGEVPEVLIELANK